MQQKSMDARWSIRETAQYVGVDEKTVRRWIANGRLTGYRMGPRLVRLDPVEVRALGRPIHKPSLMTTAESTTDGGGAQGSSPLSEDPATQLGDYIRRLVDAAPPLTDAQRSRLALLLRGIPTGGAPPGAVRAPSGASSVVTGSTSVKTTPVTHVQGAA